MRAQRPQGAASNPRGHRFGAGVVRVLSVTAVAATACAMMAGAASAATKHATTTKISASPAPHWVGAVVKLSATVKGSGRVPTGKVTFKWGTVKLCAGRLSGGKTSCNVRFPRLGTYAVKGYYSGNATHKASTSGRISVVVRRSATTTKITKITPDPVKDGVVAIVNVHVTAPAGTPVPTGTVHVAPTNVVGSTAGYTCSATLVNGTGACTVDPPVPSYGLVDFKATYLGNAAHRTSVSGTTVLPVEETTTTTVTPAKATAGSVTLSADVVGAGDADLSPPFGSGTVTFYNGTTVIAGCGDVSPTDPTKGPDNVATCTTTLAAGTYTINAVYSGDDVNLTSTGTVTLVVS